MDYYLTGAQDSSGCAELKGRVERASKERTSLPKCCDVSRDKTSVDNFVTSVESDDKSDGRQVCDRPHNKSYSSTADVVT